MKNCGTVERAVRLIAGAGLIVAAFYVTGIWTVVLAGLGGSALMPAVTGVCPLWRVMGVSTAGKA